MSALKTPFLYTMKSRQIQPHLCKFAAGNLSVAGLLARIVVLQDFSNLADKIENSESVPQYFEYA